MPPKKKVQGKPPITFKLMSTREREREQKKKEDQEKEEKKKQEEEAQLQSKVQPLPVVSCPNAMLTELTAHPHGFEMPCFPPIGIR